ncbi:MAG: metal-sulfur cluster assembly factor [Dehalococcoidales bacterium]|nr:metal-sulfur cluster assembly factor [Dehalococcoidales bacterium]
MVTQEKVLEALKDCYDPEIPVNIIDLGLVYGVEIEEDKVKVKMTMTAPGCPLHATIANDVKSHLLAVEGVKDAKVDIVWEPPWTQSRITPEGKKALGWG